MTKRWVGIVVSGDKVIVVDAEVPDAGQLVLQNDDTWKMQGGDRAAAYNVIGQQCHDYLRANGVTKVLIKASAVSLGATKIGHLRSAELRGVIKGAAASVCEVKEFSKAALSRNFGDRKVDEYAKDDAFWMTHFTGEELRVGSREAAIMLLAESGRNE
ncbi:hypothetical protein [Pseudodonghicola flavimaris]|uniref:Uncharacterized protein n=1 Tax=Pseudodonghicola flavimaris TaxID=3050036 RepID=A0ABT7EW03_9RHOB|nr:hypothetical protein [Pseudodonghicola flavimaris]MDK3016516.1 hypothetical protein [Pseudodonghicola flavimaris]